VIHTVGPVWQGGGAGEAETLARCYRTSLALAAEHALRAISFPSISTGAFGFPVAEAAAVAVRAVRDVLAEGPPMELVRFVLFSDGDLTVYRKAAEDAAA
jgi:O-acetyl-ADP-ribose deacetylase (regulator of RNase III)